ncbi:UbiX family flavin prenyltransferase [Methanolobus halotolerans]|uniref:Flavin prenyltransferase UbiX n=1 Tax=Methanolobus halotolerans TaxID=2052935 RepID=A0A4E0Q1Y4_9EURY|nr:UbiX family flavin prenyltransferase [Methanolobus halotolerans]TGC11115.1 aromatic acid decarboxylase [Methanolobus halotolerans]
MEIAIGISGASGSMYGIRLLEILSKMDIVTHLVITKAARLIIEIETDYSVIEVEGMASHVYSEGEFTAPIASGSHRFAGMIVAPCSMKTLGEIAGGMSDNLLGRAADVCLKERRKLVLMPRETPLSQIHLENMLKLERAGAIILPACPGFYSRPATIDDLINSMAGRALDLMGIDNDVYKRWG